MWRTKWPDGQQGLSGRKLGRHAVDSSCFDRLVRFHEREDRRHALRQHSLPGPRRPNHQYVVAACRRNLECTLGLLLSLHISVVVFFGRPDDKQALTIDLNRSDLLRAPEK